MPRLLPLRLVLLLLTFFTVNIVFEINSNAVEAARSAEVSSAVAAETITARMQRSAVVDAEDDEDEDEDTEEDEDADEDEEDEDDEEEAESTATDQALQTATTSGASELGDAPLKLSLEKRAGLVTTLIDDSEDSDAGTVLAAGPDAVTRKVRVALADDSTTNFAFGDMVLIKTSTKAYASICSGCATTANGAKVDSVYALFTEPVFSAYWRIAAFPGNQNSSQFAIFGDNGRALCRTHAFTGSTPSNYPVVTASTLTPNPVNCSWSFVYVPNFKRYYIVGSDGACMQFPRTQAQKTSVAYTAGMCATSGTAKVEVTLGKWTAPDRKMRLGDGDNSQVLDVDDGDTVQLNAGPDGYLHWCNHCLELANGTTIPGVSVQDRSFLGSFWRIRFVSQAVVTFDNCFGRYLSVVERRGTQLLALASANMTIPPPEALWMLTLEKSSLVIQSFSKLLPIARCGSDSFSCQRLRVGSESSSLGLASRNHYTFSLEKPTPAQAFPWSSIAEEEMRLGETLRPSAVNVTQAFANKGHQEVAVLFASGRTALSVGAKFDAPRIPQSLYGSHDEVQPSRVWYVKGTVVSLQSCWRLRTEATSTPNLFRAAISPCASKKLQLARVPSRILSEASRDAVSKLSDTELSATSSAGNFTMVYPATLRTLSDYNSSMILDMLVQPDGAALFRSPELHSTNDTAWYFGLCKDCYKAKPGSIQQIFGAVFRQGQADDELLRAWLVPIKSIRLHDAFINEDVLSLYQLRSNKTAPSEEIIANVTSRIKAFDTGNPGLAAALQQLL